MFFKVDIHCGILSSCSKNKEERLERMIRRSMKDLQVCSVESVVQHLLAMRLNGAVHIYHEETQVVVDIPIFFEPQTLHQLNDVYTPLLSISLIAPNRL